MLCTGRNFTTVDALPMRQLGRHDDLDAHDKRWSQVQPLWPSLERGIWHRDAPERSVLGAPAGDRGCAICGNAWQTVQERTLNAIKPSSDRKPQMTEKSPKRTFRQVAPFVATGGTRSFAAMIRNGTSKLWVRFSTRHFTHDARQLLDFRSIDQKTKMDDRNFGTR